MNSKSILLISLILIAGLGVYSYLQQQHLTALTMQVDELASMNKTLASTVKDIEQITRQITLDVDCTNDESINAALATISDSTDPVVITISGVCTENVIVSRSNVTLKGNSRTDGILSTYDTSPKPYSKEDIEQGRHKQPRVFQSEDEVMPLLVTAGARQVVLENLTISGGYMGLVCSNGAEVTARDITVNRSLSGAVAAFSLGLCIMINSTIERNAVGAVAAMGGHLILADGIVQHNNIGIIAARGGTVRIASQGDFFGVDEMKGTLIQENKTGIFVRTGNTVVVRKAKINNNDIGINVEQRGTLLLASEVSISENKGDAITAGELATITLRHDTVITNNAGYGLACDNDATLVIHDKATITNNDAGDVAKNCQ